MSSAQILSEEFAQAAMAAGLRARRNALAAGHPVVFVDDCGRFVEELLDATVHEVRFRSGTPRESHLEIVKEIFLPVK